MTYDQLEMLERIVEKGSFKAAAESLFKSQPSLSVAIKKLEEEFGLVIFNREEYRPKLTEAGRVFHGWAKQCLRSFRELEVVGKQLGTHQTEPHITLVIDPLVRFEAVEGIFNECLQWPNMSEITFRSEVLGGGVRSLVDGDADFAIAPKIGARQDDIESVAFQKTEMVPVVAKSLLKRGESIDTLWLKNHRQVVVQLGDRRNLFKKDSHGVMAEGQKCFVTDHTLKGTLIRKGFGWGRLAYDEVKTELRRGDLVKIQHEDVQSFTLEFHVMRCKLKPMGPVANLIWNHLRDKAHKSLKKKN